MMPHIDIALTYSDNRESHVISVWVMYSRMLNDWAEFRLPCRRARAMVQTIILMGDLPLQNYIRLRHLT